MLKGSSFNNEVIDSNARSTNAGGISEAQDKANALHARLSGASFQLVPSAYKEGTVYSGTGVNGDLSFTRGGDAWRTNKDGLVQRVPWNLALQSQTLNSSPWIMFTGPAVTPNSTTAPDGTLTADTINSAGGGNDFLYQSASLTVGTIYTMSFYVKNLNSNQSSIWTNNGGIFNINWSGSTLTSISSPGVFSLIGNGWYRVSATFTYTGGANNNRIYPDSANTSKSIYLWGYQLVEGTNPLPYFPTTNRLNVPRLDYSNGSSPSLLLEPQRTNLSLNSVWANSGGVPTSWILSGLTTGTLAPVSSIKNAGVSAYRFVCSTQRSEFYQIFTITTGTVLCFSAYVENATIPVAVNQVLRVGPITGAGTFVFFKNGVLITDLTIVEAGFTYTKQLTCTSTGDFQFRIGAGVSSTVTADITLSMPQYEVGAYPTSYIGTTTANVTRLVDSFTRNNIYTNGLITESGGTWFVEFKNNIIYTRDAPSTLAIQTSLVSSSEAFVIKTFGTARMFIGKRVSNVETALYNTVTDLIKVVIKWNKTTCDVFVNGVKQVSASSFTTTNMEVLRGSAEDVLKYIQQMALFPTPLSDAECINLTSDYTDGSSITGNYERYVNNLGGTVENLSGVTNLIQNLK